MQLRNIANSLLSGDYHTGDKQHFVLVDSVSQEILLFVALS